MKAVKYYGRRDIRFEEVEIPQPQENEVRIKVSDVGLCQTQINEFIEGPFIINDAPHPLTQKHMPLIPGHEYGGVIDAVGEGVSETLIGEQIGVLSRISCGKCEYCQAHKEHLCTTLAYYGLLGEDGGMAEYAIVGKEHVFPVSKRELITYVEPLLVGIHAYNILKPMLKDQQVLILGAGAIGICLAAVLRDYARKDVVICDPMANRCKRVEKAGFKIVENKQQIAPNSFEFVVDCAGSDQYSKEAALHDAFRYAKKGGTVLGLGSYFHPLESIPFIWTINEQKLLNSFSYDSKDLLLLGDVIESIKVDFSIFNTTISLDNIIEDGYLRAEVDKDSFTRLVIQ